ncbi:type II toxin-antitoxin system RatA family toxin [Methylomagnum sp.]
MGTVTTSVCVNYTPMEMFDLVNDVQAYPAYLPMCHSVKLLAKSPHSVRATITLAKGKIKLSFTTDNALQAGKSIHMRLVEGPFKRLNGVWRFEPIPSGGCEASFKLDFEFANGLLGMAFGGFFKEVSESLVDAFCRQAARRYGERAAH